MHVVGWIQAQSKTRVCTEHSASDMVCVLFFFFFCLETVRVDAENCLYLGTFES